ncbi:PREDICTED: apolipoprotein L2 [Myotis davidii]|uniref:Apolipoprotein L3 n=1 Tax=Myotis davidii TaxID=225400 RepID=L5M9K5_MYODS|nr:PREDICTED: apolipoprotein L2 [Myotis davidii]ELK35036.1 Apolipoprotein L3 [Myotis davidii]
MTSEADGICPDGKDFVDAIEYLMDPKDKEKLQRLLSDESWERFVAAAKLSRDEADALYADLRELETLVVMEAEDMPSVDQLHGESFMKEFPQVKQDLEERIRKLYALADEVDKVHRDCTISKVAASSTGAVSGILTIVGLSLAPVTAGISLVLSATGMGLGAAAAVTGVTTGIVEASKNASAKAKARHLVPTGSDTEKVVEKVLSRNTPKIAFLAPKCFQSVKNIVKNARAFNLAKSNPVLAAEATSVMHTGAVSAQGGNQLQKAFGGTVLAMSKGARIAGIAAAGVFLLIDVVNIVKESKHLHEGAKARSAKELRQLAQELEKRLEELTRIHEILQGP